MMAACNNVAFESIKNFKQVPMFRAAIILDHFLYFKDSDDKLCLEINIFGYY